MHCDSDNDRDDEDNDVESKVDAPDADDVSKDGKIIKTDENTIPTNDKDKHNKGFVESDEELFWTEDETKLAVALWNNMEPNQITHVKGRWYHMYSGRTSPLRYLKEDFMADAVKANKGRVANDLINPWQKKIKAKEPELVEFQKQEAEPIAKTMAKNVNNSPRLNAPLKNQLRKDLSKNQQVKGNTMHPSQRKKLRQPRLRRIHNG